MPYSLQNTKHEYPAIFNSIYAFMQRRNACDDAYVWIDTRLQTMQFLT